MATRAFEVSEIGTITVYKRRGSKNIRISLTHDGQVRVTIPLWAPYKAALTFVMQKKQWILAQQGERPSALVNQQKIGKYHTLYFESDPEVTTIRSRLSRGAVTVKYPSTETPASMVVQNAARSGAQKALRQQAEQLLPQRLRQLADTNGFEYKSCSVRHLKSRWGSCTSHKDITLNYFLMQLPWRLIDYVLIHELAHTKHLNHGPDFWFEVGKFIPDFKLRRKELKEFQPSVMSL